MRATFIGIVLALAVTAVSTPASAGTTCQTCYQTCYDSYGYAYNCNPYQCNCTTTSATSPEVHRMFFMKDNLTGDSGMSTCDTGRSGRYTTPMYYVDLYRGLNNAAVGTAGWGGYTLYQCKRTVAAPSGTGRIDEYLATTSTCTMGSYYGTRVDTSKSAGYTLSAAYEGTSNTKLYLCSATTYDSKGGYYTELRVLPNLCSTGSVQVAFLGYARGQPAVSGEKDGVIGSQYDQCVATSGCFGQCGKDCDGLFGTHYSTSECLAHDRCVCQNGGNMWSMNCLGDFLLAAVSWAVKAFVALVKTVVGFVVSVVKSVLRALCFWC